MLESYDAPSNEQRSTAPPEGNSQAPAKDAQPQR
jgi:hypothetical protein